MAFVELVVRPFPECKETLYYAFGGEAWFILMVLELVFSSYSEADLLRINIDGL